MGKKKETKTAAKAEVKKFDLTAVFAKYQNVQVVSEMGKNRSGDDIFLGVEENEGALLSLREELKAAGYSLKVDDGKQNTFIMSGPRPTVTPDPKRVTATVGRIEKSTGGMGMYSDDGKRFITALKVG